MTDYYGGPENNSYLITISDGSSYIDGGGGTDTLTLDWSGSTTQQYGQAYGATNGYSFSFYDYGTAYSVSGSNVENLVVKFGSADDTFYAYANAVVAFNGGGGNDLFYGDFSTSTANISFTLNGTAGSTSTFTGQGSSVTNVERIQVTTGAGNDSLTGGALADTLNAGDGTNSVNGGAGDDSITSSGIDTINGGDGNDNWTGNYGAMTSALTMTEGSGLSYGFSNGTSVTNVEYLTVYSGSGNDTLLVKTGGQFYAGDGNDNLTIDWSTSTTQQYAQAYGSSGSYSVYAYDYGTAYSISGNAVETLVVKFGSADDTFYAYANGVGVVNGGGGNDFFYGDFSTSTANISFTLNGTAGSTSTFTGQGSSVTNVERIQVTTGSGNDSLTGGALADTLNAGDGTNSVNGGAGDDSITSSGIDTINGGDGNDNWTGNYGAMTSALTMTEGSGLSYGFSNGTSVTNVEYLTVYSGSGNDTLLVKTGGQFYAGDGNDNLTIDWSTSTTQQYAQAYGSSGSYSVYAYDYGTAYSISGNAVETLVVKFGSADDTFYAYANGVGVVNGGGGNDLFYGDFSTSTANISFTLNGTAGSTSTFTGQGSSVTNVERIQATTGSGNDSLTGGALADTLNAGDGTNSVNGGAGDDSITSSGIDTINGGDGNDSWTGNYGAMTSALTMTEGSGLSYGFSNGTSVTNVEYLTVYSGSGNDTLLVKTGGQFYAGDGNDNLTIDWSTSTTQQYAQAYGSSGSYSVYAYDYGTAYSISGNAVETLVVKFGSADDTFYAYTNGVGVVNGGGGNDLFYGDFSTSTANISFTLNGTAGSTSTFTGQGSSVTNVERIQVTTGSGNDSLTGGALADTLNGNTGNDTIDGGAGDDLLYGGDGTDTLSFASSANAITFSLATNQAGYYDAGNGTDYVEGFENLTGSALNDTLTGTSAANVIDGGAGADSMAGGGGNDIYIVDNVGDVVTEASGSGTDEVRTSLSSYTLTSNVERLRGTVSTGQTLNGNTLANTITGGDGNDIINGGSGADSMSGGLGNDIYYVDNASDVVTEAASAGTDEIRTALASYTLGTNLENLTGTSSSAQTLTGNSLANSITGGAGNDTLNGGDGNDVLDGGTGNDSMTGGTGNDTYIVDNSGDVVTETASAGTDTVRTSLASYTLGSNVENLVGTLSTGQTLTGNSLANSIAGGAGNDIIDGGTGADSMAGGGGNDLYYVDHASDVVTEATSGGTDEVRSSIASYTLNTNVENLVGTLSTGQTLNGNSIANSITGGAGNDAINGGGGADTMAGGLGNDTYVVDSSGDIVTEAASAGTDTVRTAISTYTLTSNVENLVGTSSTGQTLKGNSIANSITGGAGNDVINAGGGADTMAGGLGNDLYYVDNSGDIVTEAASAGTDEVRVAIASYTLTANVENLVGTLSTGQTLTGNSLANSITGGAGNDIIDGGTGADSMTGGLGNDVYYVDHASDVVTEATSGGTDEVRSSLASYTLNTNVENLVGTLSTGQTLNGNSLANSITGGAGNDAINGGGGADTMAGGLGNDTYVVDSSGDIVTEAASAGTDTVRTAISTYTLTSNVENLVGTSSTGQTLKGNSIANSITGGAGNDVINAGGGADTMAGGLGNDLYYVDNSGDIVTEAASAGTDEVRVAIASYTLTANVENLVGTLSTGQTLTGNSLANSIAGGAGNDIIDGGTGADSMTGGLGNDVYYVDHASDVVTEAASGGTDEVRTSLANYTLNTNAENLLGTLATGQTLNGNSLANSITGGAGNDIINGGAGADTMSGGRGNDVYYVDNAGDVVIETISTAGSDTIFTSVSYSLTGYIETLTLTSTANLSGTGNDYGQTINGNSGNNSLSGLGGIDILNGFAGNDNLNGGSNTDTLNGGDGNDILDGGTASDTLTGGAGVDIFAFMNTPGASNIDTITDFSVADDTIQLNDAAFAGLSVGALGANAFVIGTSALDVDDRIIYNDSTGALFFDSDGSGAGAAVQFATISTGLGLTAADFVIV